MRNWKLSWQLYSYTLMITFSALLALGWYASHAIQDFNLRQTASTLETRAQVLKQILQEDPALDQGRMPQLDTLLASAFDSRITLVSSS